MWRFLLLIGNYFQKEISGYQCYELFCYFTDIIYKKNKIIFEYYLRIHIFFPIDSYTV